MAYLYRGVEVVFKKWYTRICNNNNGKCCVELISNVFF